MGESAVLVHSYSFAAPITRNDSHEDNTIHALSQSISFGKFMTENLEWGKWSSFSHKKYVEEAEKYSRPGSVAQKKAFFEAHYKRIAEAKKAATEEQPTVTPAEVLLHTLETQPPPPPLNKLQQEEVKVLKDDEEELERNSFQIDDDAVLDSKPVTDELGEKEMENGMISDDDKLEKKKQEEEVLKDDWSIGEKEKQRKSITKNRPVFRLSLEKTIPPKSLDEITLTEKRSERPITQSLEKNEVKPVHRQRFSFLNCFKGNAKTQDQNQSRKKRKTEKKKQSLCLCLKPKNVRE
ncbi:Protein WVD2-like 7 [Cardamine amara subsp. amara]|uniref:Protein WVD2-like 7 n=1 Tax=Cardamine amara subsp. amara TaxID=228776 RepID=A0ABD0ZFX3_CARAN